MYDIQTDTIIYKNYKIENFFDQFNQQDYIKDYVKNNLIVLYIGGSHAYGLNTASSDLDIRGIFKNNIDQILGYEKIEQLENNSKDITIYSLSKILKLIIDQGPNAQEALWCDKEEILYATDEYWYIRNLRDQLLSKLAKHKYSGYALSQLKRLRGHSRWLTKEQEGKFDKKPNIIDYITFIDKSNGNVSKYSFKSKQFYFMKVKDEIYNVFWTGSYNNFPLIEEGNNFIPVQLEHPFKRQYYYGVIWFNKSQFQTDLDEYNKWKTWKENRNETRHELEEKYGYDTKHACHVFRLLNMGIEILRDKKVNVKRPDRDFLLDIRNGKYSYEWIVAEAARLEKEVLEQAYIESTLQNSVDKKVYVDIIKKILNL